MERNNKACNGQTTQMKVLLAHVDRLISEHNTYTQWVYKNSLPRQMPSENRYNIIKLNLNASLAVEGWIGMRIVARDDKEGVLFVTSRRVRGWWPSKIAKSKVVRFAIKLTQRHGYDNIIVESDSQVLVSQLSKVVVFMSEFDSILEDILFFCYGFLSIIWSHVKRGCNYVAHNLAIIVSFEVEQVWENLCPLEVYHYVQSDTLSLD